MKLKELLFEVSKKADELDYLLYIFHESDLLEESVEVLERNSSAVLNIYTMARRELNRIESAEYKKVMAVKSND